MSTDITDNDKNAECEDFLMQKAFNRVTKLDLSNAIESLNTGAGDYTNIFLFMGA